MQSNDKLCLGESWNTHPAAIKYFSPLKARRQLLKEAMILGNICRHFWKYMFPAEELEGRNWD